MNERPSELHCSRCGETNSGRFCTACGTALREVKCESCGHTAEAGARFCPDCGAGLGGAAPGSSAATRRPERIAQLIGGAAVLVLVAFVAGQAAGRRSVGGAGAASPDQGPAVALAGAPTAPDISSMSPEERASRLFNRVMLYSEQGKADSARFFAPMAIQAIEMIGQLDAHGRYDIGVISSAVGDAARARQEADAILAARQNHLLGLVLAIKAADLTGDSTAATRFTRRLVAAAPAERATALKEYGEHARDIDDALKKAASVVH